MVLTPTILKRNVSFFDIYETVLKRQSFFLTADEANKEKSKIKITENEACLLQNQVRQEIKHILIHLSMVFRIFELKLMLMEIYFELTI